MIQELLGGVIEERKVSIPSHTSSSVSSQPQPASGEPQQNLRCPRCDSSNTKFCYYNNYNLTQPRHFCKTCRRYWTKGGALRNVPIGGGCRKARALPIAVATAGLAGKSSVSKMTKPASTSEFLARSDPIGVLDHEMLQSPILWTNSSPHAAHLIALLKAAAVQNPNPKSTPSFSSNSIMAAQPAISAFSTNGQSADQLDQVPFQASLWRNSNQGSPTNHYQLLPQSQLYQQDNLLFSGSGIHELCQKSKLSDIYADEQYFQAIAREVAGGLDTCCSSAPGTMTMATSVTTSVMDPLAIPLAVGEFSYWNSTQAFPSWADISTANGALP